MPITISIGLKRFVALTVISSIFELPIEAPLAIRIFDSESLLWIIAEPPIEFFAWLFWYKTGIPPTIVVVVTSALELISMLLSEVPFIIAFLPIKTLLFDVLSP